MIAIPPERRRISPVCIGCSHYDAEAQEQRCPAFPDGIPDIIWNGENTHRTPVEGDHGIQFAEAYAGATEDVDTLIRRIRAKHPANRQ